MRELKSVSNARTCYNIKHLRNRWSTNGYGGVFVLFEQRGLKGILIKFGKVWVGVSERDGIACCLTFVALHL